ncbi:7821_t:CDS:1, partial [Dentiscutata erythropus]
MEGTDILNTRPILPYHKLKEIFEDESKCIEYLKAKEIIPRELKCLNIY